MVWIVTRALLMVKMRYGSFKSFMLLFYLLSSKNCKFDLLSVAQVDELRNLLLYFHAGKWELLAGILHRLLPLHFKESRRTRRTHLAE